MAPSSVASVRASRQARYNRATSGVTIEVGMVPAWITLAADGAKVFTLNFLSDDISVVDTETFEVIETVSTGAGGQAIIGNITPDGSTLYVTNHASGELMAIDTERI